MEVEGVRFWGLKREGDEAIVTGAREKN